MPGDTRTSTPPSCVNDGPLIEAVRGHSESPQLLLNRRIERFPSTPATVPLRKYYPILRRAREEQLQRKYPSVI
ncbi:unnamed protein product [Acanthoscelides obtectus]|uniref:Uncharacterized protein n=1 Tax=Acanthoscelides obtectus TaxID=200917 RepID=A0A9P0LVB0_ACAOB|nr:unnamed protein product [Acanthoscelides obtectus]CAK1643633.1 hypothetical protein AOBTE_LOCUS13613 [Acanthoscelides obtectus]